jgi:tRNA(Ile)-lysidine synthase
MLTRQIKEKLSKEKNLLAFSAGIDSTALFFLLQEANISFDIAIVDYGLRQQSKEELAYAQELSTHFNLHCYTAKAPYFQSNFELQAREFRYNFFQTIIKEHEYTTLLTAHHLGDRLEWMLMQLCRGGGTIELAGMQEEELRDGYKLLRPLLSFEKEELLEYLHKNNKKYFIDSSNNNMQYERNYFRKEFAQPLLQRYKAGIKRTFTYLDEDKSLLIEERNYLQTKKLYLFKKGSYRTNIYHSDKILKSFGHLMRASEKNQLKSLYEVVVGRKYIICEVQEYIAIAPYIQAKGLDKSFKEQMRKLKINPKLRGYLASEPEAVLFLSKLLA